MTTTKGVIGSRHLNLGRTRKSVILGGAALAVGLLGSSGAWAECTSTVMPPAVGTIFGPINPLFLFPLSQGGAVNTLLSTINTANTAFATQTSAFVSSPGNPQPDQQGGGVWGRSIAGTVDTQNTGVLTPPPTIFGNPPIPLAGAITCNTNSRSDYTGFQFGHDISILNGGGSGANWHWGVTAGYFEASSKDVSSGPPDPSFSAGTRMPFAGLYTAFTKGNFFIDGQARWDFINNNLTDVNNGLFNQNFNARTFSLTGNLGYNIPLQNNWFIEPSGGVVWSRTTVDPLNVSGTLVLANSPFLGLPGSVQIEDIDSVLGRVNVSVGTSFTNGPVTWQPYFTATVFHEFAGDVTTRITTNFGALNFSDPNSTATLTTSRVGTYGQFALGTAAVLGNTGWLGYARADYRIGENIEGWSVNAGLRYQFSPPPGRGSIKDAPVHAVSSYNWTGPYIGAYAGRTWGQEDWRFVAPPNSTVDPEFGGYLVGGQAGYNQQVGRIVVGLEGDYGSSNSLGGKSCPSQFFFTCEAEVSKLASLTGRLGVTWGRALFYAKGGWAGGEVTAKGFLNIDGNPVFQGLPIPPGPFVNPTQASHWANGWTVGGGMEFALTDRWSAKAEYMHYDLGKERFVVSTFGGVPVDVVDADARGDIVRIGVNLHFNPIREAVPLK